MIALTEHSNVSTLPDSTLPSDSPRQADSPRQSESTIPADSTLLNACRYSSVMLTGITMSAAMAHLMELPAKMTYEAPLYVRLHRTLYETFHKVAGPAEAGAVAVTAALAWLTRRRHRDAHAELLAAGCLAAAHALFWPVVHPANNEMLGWRLEAIPEGWEKWRNRWEYGHAVRAVLVTTALAALALSKCRVSRSHDYRK